MKNRKRTLFTRSILVGAVAFALVLAVIAVPGTIFAADWDLDFTWDTDGTVTTDIGSSTADDGRAMAVQANDQVVMAGTSANDFAVVRYTTVGALDATFGTAGITTTDIGAGTTDAGRDVAIQIDGMIVVAGISDNDFAVARYTTVGVLDAAFGTGGIVTTDIGSGTTDAGNSVAIQADGRIVVAGLSGNDFAVVRYNTDGTLDTTFDTDGILTTDFAGGLDYADEVAIQADGQIVVLGTSGTDIGVARYNTDGSLDTAFDTDGLQTVNICDTDYGTGLGIQADGKIVVGGWGGDPGAVSCIQIGSPDLTIGRLNANGSLDTATYAVPNGVASQTFGGVDNSNSLTIMLDGKAMLVGGNGNDYGLQRWNIDGTIDTTFDGDGRLLVNVDGADTGYASARQSDGRLLVGGTSSNNFSSARFGQSTHDDAIITKTAIDLNGAPLYVGDTIRYTITIDNPNALDITGVVVTDTLPAGVTFVSATPSADSGSNPLVWNVGTITALNTWSVTIDVEVDGSSNPIGGNVAIFSSDQQVGTSTPPILPPDGGDVYFLTLAKVAEDLNGAPLYVGDVIRYTINITNTHLLTMTNVVVEDMLPAGVTFDSATPVADSGPNPLIWNVGTLAAGANWSVTIDVHVDGTANPIDGNVATVNSDQQNEDSTDPTLPPGGGDITYSNLTLVKTAVDVNGAPLYDGDVIRYTINITNENLLAITNVVLTDTLPAGVTFDYATPTADSGPNPLVWNVGTLAAGANWSVTIDVHVDGTANPIGGNMATVNSDQQNEGSIGPILPPGGGDVTPFDALALAKTAVDVNGAPLYEDDVIRYTISITNENGSAMTNVVVTDTLPAGVTFDFATPVADSGPNPLIWNVGTLAAGANWSVTIDVHVDGTANPIGGNMAAVNSDQQNEGSVGPILPPDGGDITTIADLAISQSIEINFLTTVFTIVAQNNGPDAADGTVVSVTFPAEIDVLYWTCAGDCAAISGTGQTIYETIATFSSGGIATYTVRTNVSGVHESLAQIIPPSGVTDPDMDNNESAQMSAYLIILPLIYNNASFSP